MQGPENDRKRYAIRNETGLAVEYFDRITDAGRAALLASIRQNSEYTIWWANDLDVVKLQLGTARNGTLDWNGHGRTEIEDERATSIGMKPVIFTWADEEEDSAILWGYVDGTGWSGSLNVWVSEHHREYTARRLRDDLARELRNTDVDKTGFIPLTGLAIRIISY